MPALSAYIPADRQRSIVSGIPLPTRAHGSVLFADISGFTPLTEALTRALGPSRGAEELVVALDRVYDSLLRQVHQFGGSVINFSGDGVLCYFDGSDARCAAAAALGMQKAIQEFKNVSIPQGGSVSITAKVAVASGSIRRFQVGNPSIQLLDAVAGTTVDRMAEATQLTNKGEVVCDEPTLQALSGIATAKGWRTGILGRHAVLSGLNETVPIAIDVLPEPGRLSDEQVRPWLLAPVYNRLISRQGDFLAELRYAVPLFLSFGGIDYDNDDLAGEKLDRFVCWVQQVATRYEGTLIDLSMGDKGSYIYMVFGAPIAHDDDAGHALDAAMDFHKLPEELNFIAPIRIGISQGRIRAGAYGSVQRHTYGVLGDEVNVAARLMERAAPNQTFVTERIAQAVGERYRFTPMGNLPIKGKQETVNVFRLMEKGERLPQKNTQKTIVGRAAERALFSEKLNALLQHKNAHTVIIEGEAGIGKTRLLQDLRQEAQSLSAATLVGMGNAIEKSTPYYAWRPVFSQVFNMDTGLSESKTVDHARVISSLESDLPADFLHLLPLLNSVLPLDLPDNELTAQMSGLVRSENTQLLLTQILMKLALKTPLVLEMEDAHWFDSASWSLTRRIAGAGYPVLLVIATRPLVEPFPAEYQNLLAERETTQLLLAPMPLNEVHTLVAERLGVKRVPGFISELISKKAEGNPFFAEELVYALRDAGLILIEGDECKVAPNVNLSTVSLPDAVQDLVTRRIDRLDPVQQLTMKVASVIGRIFTYRLLHDSYPILEERDGLGDHLNNLTLLNLTTLETLDPELAYAFKHIITQEVSYGLMLFSQRRELHRKVAEWYEKNQSDNLSAYYALLAHHWINAEQPLKAVEYLEKAGELALHNFVNEEAVVFFEQALFIANNGMIEVHPLRQARWELQAGEAYVNLSDYANGYRQIKAGLARFGQPVPSNTPGQVTNVLKQVIQQVFHRRNPRRYIGRDKERKEDLLVLARAYERLSEATYFLGELLIPVYSAFRALNLAEEAGPSPETGRSSAAVGALLGFIPMHKIARGYLERALTLANESGHLESREFVGMTASYYYSGVGNWEEVHKQADQVILLADRLGDKRRWQDVTSHLTSVYYFQGTFAASQELAEDLFRTAQQRQDFRFMALAIQEKARYFLYTGKFDEAIAHLDTLQKLVGDGEEVTVIPLRMELLGLTSMVHLRRGAHPEAQEAAKLSLELAAKVNPSFYAAITGYTGPAEVYLTMWEAQPTSQDLAKQAKLAVQTLGKYSRVFPIGLPRLLLNQGRYDWLAGKKTQALKAWESSLRHARELEMLYDQGMAHYEIARHLDPEDPGRKEHVSVAGNIFNDLNARYDLERVHNL